MPPKRKYTVNRDYHDLRDYIFSPKAIPLPIRIDLRPMLSPVVNQGALGSCTANAIASGLKEYLLRNNQRSKDLTRLSRLYLYYYSRKLDGNVNEDSGATLRNAMKALQKYGVCPEADHPYNIRKFKTKPSQNADKHAVKYKISSYHRVTNLQSLREALAQRLPVVIGFIVYESFESAAVEQTGIVPMPKRNERQLGGHAVLAVGYDDIKKQIIIRNSWGTSWGDRGYGYMPYTMFEGSSIVSDMWTGS